MIKTNGKVTEMYAFHAEMLKVDFSTSVWVLGPFFNEEWEREEIPEDWRKKLIVKLPKKGDISIGDNSLGITLISIPFLSGNSKSDQNDRGPENPRGTGRVQSR